MWKFYKKIYLSLLGDIMKCKHETTKMEWRPETDTTVETCLTCDKIINTFKSIATDGTSVNTPQSTTIPIKISLEDGGFLKDLFIGQITLQISLGFTHIVHNVDYLTEQCIALHSEVDESLRHIPWKSWKKSQELEVDELQHEIVDIWQHLINLTIASGMGIDDLKRIYNENIKKNYNRIKEGY